MNLFDIYKFLDNVSPFELQESWDNSGLLVGDWKHDIKDIVLSIDIDEELLESLEEESLVITHHPIIFGGLKQLQFNQYPAKLLQKMLQKYFSKYLKKDDYTKAEAMAELMPEEKQFDALAALLARAVEKGSVILSRRIYAQLRQQVREQPRLKMQLLELMIDRFAHVLAIHYKDDVDNMIAALVDRGAVLYFRALHVKWQARLSLIKLGELQDKIRDMMPQAATLSSTTERGWRAMIYLLFANVLSDSH